MKQLHMFTYLLLLVGGLNWLLFGLFNWDIGMIFGGMGAPLSRLVYILVGLSAVVELVNHKDSCKYCEEMSTTSAPKKVAAKKKKKK